MRPGPISVSGNATEGHVGALVIIGPEPAGRVVLNLLNAVEQVMRASLSWRTVVVAFDIGVLLRLARLDEFDADTPVPLIRGQTNQTVRDFAVLRRQLGFDIGSRFD